MRVKDLPCLQYLLNPAVPLFYKIYSNTHNKDIIGSNRYVFAIGRPEDHMCICVSCKMYLLIKSELVKRKIKNIHTFVASWDIFLQLSITVVST